ncbi:hypothetical protein [Prosthecobacter sp.]|uniref:hypothetical protein n=1 Tax=Prosthecobacter sp. TaxID=1965333 RepID=UPI0037852B1C
MSTPRLKPSQHSKGPGKLNTDLKTFFLMMFARCHGNVQDCLMLARSHAAAKRHDEAHREVEHARSWGRECRNYMAQAMA